MREPLRESEMITVVQGVTHVAPAGSWDVHLTGADPGVLTCVCDVPALTDTYSAAIADARQARAFAWVTVVLAVAIVLASVVLAWANHGTPGSSR